MARQLKNKQDIVTKDGFIIFSDKSYLYDCIFAFLWNILILGVVCFFAFKFKWWAMFILLLFLIATPSKYKELKKR